jgi:hypothetical protein
MADKWNIGLWDRKILEQELDKLKPSDLSRRKKFGATAKQRLIKMSKLTRRDA